MGSNSQHQAVQVIMSFHEGTLEQYDKVTKELGLSPGGAGPDGALFHTVCKTEWGIQVIDTWQNEDSFTNFLREQIRPALERTSVPSPSVQIRPVYSYMTSGQQAQQDVGARRESSYTSR